ncbi:MAG TPA: SH3 domain-containing protein, partial [Rhabdochlamydiaceae bacterium]
MSKRLSYVTAVFGLCLSNVYCDGGNSETVAAQEVSAIEAVEIQPAEFTPEFSLAAVPDEQSAPATIAPVVPVTPVVPVVMEKPFSPFTGKVKRTKVRLRANADIESPIVKELHKGELLVVNGKKGDFYAVEPPAGSKAYVFRSFVLDGVVEGNRVNVRFSPSLDAPIIGHLNSGDRIQGVISSLNNKWYEISPPSGTRFYVAKEFVESIGGPELKVQLDKRRNAAEQLLDAATLLTQVEMKKLYPQM